MEGCEEIKNALDDIAQRVAMINNMLNEFKTAHKQLKMVPGQRDKGGWLLLRRAPYNFCAYLDLWESPKAVQWKVCIPKTDLEHRVLFGRYRDKNKAIACFDELLKKDC